MSQCEDSSRHEPAVSLRLVRFDNGHKVEMVCACGRLMPVNCTESICNACSRAQDGMDYTGFESLFPIFDNMVYPDPEDVPVIDEYYNLL